MRKTKLRFWDTKEERMIYELSIHTTGGDIVNVLNWPDCIRTQCIELKDKNNEEAYEGDLLRIKHKMSDNKEHYTDSIYRVNIMDYNGLSLSFVKLYNDEKDNQFPIHQRLVINDEIKKDYVNQKYDNLAIMDTFGENHMSGKRWAQNHYSNDIEIIGNIYENKDLLS